MSGFEYKVVPAPMRGLKAKGIKGTPARFAFALQTVMNEMGAQGWEYQRTDTLPVEERQGFTGKTTTFQHLLVFRRPRVSPAAPIVEAPALIEDQSDAVVATVPDADTDNIAAHDPQDSATEVSPETEGDDSKARKTTP